MSGRGREGGASRQVHAGMEMVNAALHTRQLLQWLSAARNLLRDWTFHRQVSFKNQRDAMTSAALEFVLRYRI